MKYSAMPLSMILRDSRPSFCIFCQKEKSPEIRFIYGFTDEQLGDVGGTEIGMCESCADKRCKGWRKSVQ